MRQEKTHVNSLRERDVGHENIWILPCLKAVAVAITNEREEFFARFDVAERALHARSDGGGMLLFDTAHHHAEVAGFDDDADAERVDDLLNRLSDLGGEALLYL